MKSLFLFSVVSVCCLVGQSQNQLFIPDTISGFNFNLTMHQDSFQFFSGKKSQTYAFNQNKYLGPTLIWKKGTNISINVNNQIGDTTTVHWHGIHLPSKWDGGPHTSILPNAAWNPQFTVMDHAATYWYHPHFMGKTASQAIKGAAGLIIVRDNIEASLSLPRRYGIDDIPLVVQCQQFDTNNQVMPRGMQDSTLLVNGTINPYIQLPAQVIRMRILNASGERTFNFGFTGNKQFYQIATDGGLLNNPIPTTRLRLSPGERGEILINLSGLTSQTIHLICFGSELPMGVQGGPTMPMPPGSPPMNSPLNGIDYPIMKINIVAPTTNSISSIPASLTTNFVFQESQANTFRKIKFSADSLMVMDGPFYFNDSTFDMMRIDYHIPLNNTEVWTLVNKTMVAHPFHIHDVQFFLLNRNGAPVSSQEAGRKDVVLVLPDDSVSFITKFEDFTDEEIPYMYHCHILMHEDDGMMGQFIVTSNLTGNSDFKNNKSEAIIYPNPSEGSLKLKIDSSIFESLSIFNSMGQKIEEPFSFKEGYLLMDISQLQAGVYNLSVKTKSGHITKRFIKK